MKKRFMLHPGEVRSETDGQRHYISGAELINLYGLHPGECKIKQDVRGRLFGERPQPENPDDRFLLPLWPLDKGNYKEHLNTLRATDFQRYIRAAKLADFNEQRRRKVYADGNRKQMARLERIWPEFPGAYEKVKSL